MKCSSNYQNRWVSFLLIWWALENFSPKKDTHWWAVWRDKSRETKYRTSWCRVISWVSLDKQSREFRCSRSFFAPCRRVQSQLIKFFNYWSFRRDSFPILCLSGKFPNCAENWLPCKFGRKFSCSPAHWCFSVWCTFSNFPQSNIPLQ